MIYITVLQVASLPATSHVGSRRRKTRIQGTSYTCTLGNTGTVVRNKSGTGVLTFIYHPSSYLLPPLVTSSCQNTDTDSSRTRTQQKPWRKKTRMCCHRLSVPCVIVFIRNRNKMHPSFLGIHRRGLLKSAEKETEQNKKKRRKFTNTLVT